MEKKNTVKRCGVYRFGTHEVFFSKMPYIHVRFCKPGTLSWKVKYGFAIFVDDGYLILKTKYLHAHFDVG